MGVRGGKSRQLKGLAGHHSHLTQCTQVSRGGRTKGGANVVVHCVPPVHFFSSQDGDANGNVSTETQTMASLHT